MYRALFLGLALMVPWPLARADDAPKEAEAVKPWTVEGKLSADDPSDKVQKKSPHQVHAFKMTAGVIYLIDLVSPDFDSFLRLEDGAGQQLMADNDGGGYPHARITYKAAKTDAYRIIVTNLDGKAGRFTLTAAEATGPLAVLDFLKTEFKSKAQDLFQEFRNTKDENEKDNIKERYFEAAAQFLGQLHQFAEENAKDAIAKDARKQGIPLLAMLSEAESPRVSKQLRLIVANSTDKEFRGLASLMLGKHLTKQYEQAYQKKDKAAPKWAADAEAFLKQTAEKYSDVVVNGRIKLADQIQDALFMLQNLSVGKKALEIEAEDIDGQVFKLSEYRGKVVVLDFWGHW